MESGVDSVESISYFAWDSAESSVDSADSAFISANVGIMCL